MTLYHSTSVLVATAEKKQYLFKKNLFTLLGFDIDFAKIYCVLVVKK